MAGELFINVLSARGLRDVEGFGGGKNDPYTKLIHYSSKGEKVVQTPYINEAGANPVWTNQEFKFEIVQPQSEELKVEVWDYNIGKDVIIGSVVFPVHQLLHKEGENFYTLAYGTPENRKTAGEVCLKFTYRADKSIAASSQAHAAPQSALFMQPANVKSGPAPAPVPTHGPAATPTAGAIPPPGPTPGPVTLERRKQTLAVLMFFLTPWLCILASLYCVRLEGFPFYFFLLYVGWILLFQEYNRKGGFPIKLFRELTWWRWFAGFFPMKLVKVAGAAFPTSKNYIFGVHPHGIISLGAFINFGTEATGWSHQFPGVYPHLCTLRSNFMIPFYGFYLSALGIVDASKESIKHVLGSGVGQSVAIVLGGAKESLDAKPGTYDLTLKERKGFVKIAIETGASLVPCFSFGENEVYDQVNNSVGTPLRKLQDRMEQLMGFALPLIKGRGVFNYSFGLLPHRRAIVTVVGAPIAVDKATPTPELIDKVHKQYIDALTKLYDDHKKEYSIDPNAEIKIK